MACGLHQAFVSSGRAMRMPDMIQLAKDSYGEWDRQGQPGGVKAQRELFETMLDINNKSDPKALLTDLESVATRHGFRLSGQIADTARVAFEGSQDTGAGHPGTKSEGRN